MSRTENRGEREIMKLRRELKSIRKPHKRQVDREHLPTSIRKKLKTCWKNKEKEKRKIKDTFSVYKFFKTLHGEGRSGHIEITQDRTKVAWYI